MGGHCYYIKALSCHIYMRAHDSGATGCQRTADADVGGRSYHKLPSGNQTLKMLPMKPSRVGSTMHQYIIIIGSAMGPTPTLIWSPIAGRHWTEIRKQLKEATGREIPDILPNRWRNSKCK